MSETLLLEVQCRAGERGTLRGGREDRSPGRQSALHGWGNKKNCNGIKESRDEIGQPEENEDGLGDDGKEEREARDEAKVSKIFQALLSRSPELGGRST